MHINLLLSQWYEVKFQDCYFGYGYNNIEGIDYLDNNIISRVNLHCLHFLVKHSTVSYSVRISCWMK